MTGRPTDPSPALASSFTRDDSGAVAIILALSLIPLLAIGGAALDYARGAKAKEQLRQAVDAAALAAAQKIGGAYAERRSAALGALEANLATSPLESLNVWVTDITTASGQGVRIVAQGVLPTTLMKVVGKTSLDIGSTAEAVAGNVGAAEIALVLDNTGSMISDMPALKTAATNFVNTVFASGSTTVKMSVVPYVAAVNVGSDFPASSLELTGTATLQAAFYRRAWVTSLYNQGCNAWASSPTPAVVPVVDPTPPVSSDPGTPVGKDKSSALTPGKGLDATPFPERSRAFARALFGVSRAAAASVTANSIDPINGTPYTVSPPYVPTPVTAIVPDGYATTTVCWLENPSVISNLDLFNRMPGASWKGCVEARKDPYDLTDDPPTPGNVDSYFVPYFAPDEYDMAPMAPQFANNYLNDTHASWVGQTAPLGWSPFDGLVNIMKYDGVNVPTIVETPPATKGPNYACPDSLLKLTNVKNNVLAKINSLNYWSGGGTVTSEGLAWGWRTISPNAPFAQGSAYGGGTKKYIVLMTDGMNSLIDNRPSGYSSLLSEYTSYGFLVQGRMSVIPHTFAKAETYLNGRMAEVCANAKAKGISIFTILFRETDATIANLLKQCASSPAQALKASDAASLNTAFSNIASQLNTLRLSK